MFSLLLVSELVLREVRCFSPCLHVPSTSLFLSLSPFDIFAVRRRSLGQGNAFTHVCLFRGVCHERAVCLPGRGGGARERGSAFRGGWADKRHFKRYKKG